MRTLSIVLALSAVVGMLVADPGNGRPRRQEHQIGLSGGHQVIIQYNIRNDENIIYGTGQHIQMLKEALSILESIAESTKQKGK